MQSEELWICSSDGLIMHVRINLKKNNNNNENKINDDGKHIIMHTIYYSIWAQWPLLRGRRGVNKRLLTRRVRVELRPTPIAREFYVCE